MSDRTTVREPRPLIIIGAGGHAVSVANVALSAGRSIGCFIDKTKRGNKLLEIPIAGDFLEINDINQYDFAIAIGDNTARELVHATLSAQRPNLHFPALVHLSATISCFACVGEGTVVMPNAVVGPKSNVGRFCIVNTGASLDHDCDMHDFSSLAPASATGGSVTIGRRSAISIGAIVKHGLTIGDDSIVGASSYLNKDLSNNQVAYGIPARTVRSRKIGDPYLG